MDGGFCVLGARELSSDIMPNLPNAEGAIIELTKLRDYCLSSRHPRGRHKARRFQDLLGLTANEADWLKQKLLAGVAIQPAEKQETDSFGSRWRVDVPLRRQGKSVVGRTGWILRTGDKEPRLITCWIL
jgi:hypothetical protein